MNKQALLFYPLLGVVLLGLFVGGLAYGAVPIPLDHVMDILLGKGSEYCVAISFASGYNRIIGGGFLGYQRVAITDIVPESVGGTFHIGH